MAARETISAILNVIEAASPIIGTAAGQGVTLGRALVSLIDQALEDYAALGGVVADVDKLRLERDALESRVNEHVRNTADSLRG